MRKIFFTASFVLIAAFAFVVWRYPSVIMDIVRGAPDPIATHVNSDTPDITLKDIATYRQDSEGWEADKMGPTSDTLGGYGCTVTSVANAVTNITGVQMSPKKLNANLGKIGGYTNRGWLIWSKVAEATSGAVKIRVHSEPSHSAIETCMAQGSYPVVKIKLGGVIPHWVLLVGRKDGEYIMRDPLLGSPTDGAIPLSVRSNKIHSLRCVSKT